MSTTEIPPRAEPAENDVWLHYKGGRYFVLMIAHDTRTGVKCVVYESATDGKIWVRPLSEWMSYVSDCEHPTGRERYTYEGRASHD